MWDKVKCDLPIMLQLRIHSRCHLEQLLDHVHAHVRIQSLIELFLLIQLLPIKTFHWNYMK